MKRKSAVVKTQIVEKSDVQGGIAIDRIYTMWKDGVEKAGNECSLEMRDAKVKCMNKQSLGKIVTGMRDGMKALGMIENFFDANH